MVGDLRWATGRTAPSLRMIPIRDNIPSSTTPFVNYIVIAICSWAFLNQLRAEPEGSIAESYGMVPARLSADADEPIITERPAIVQTRRGLERVLVRQELAPAAVAPALTFITCMFLHGGWMHFLGNMWFLYIFGDNVEDRAGHLGYAVLYLGTGVLAGLAHYVTAPGSTIPTIGASGAIAGVMGAYFYWYPHAKVQAVLPIIILLQTFVVPAPLFLGIWFVMQTFSGVRSLGGEAVGGVAWWAHIGGFVAGAAVAFALGRAHVGHEDPRVRRF